MTRSDALFSFARTWVGLGLRRVPYNDAIEVRLGWFVLIAWYGPAPAPSLSRREWVAAKHRRLRRET